MEGDASHELDFVGEHAEDAAGCFAGVGVGEGKDGVEWCAVVDALFEHVGFGEDFGVGVVFVVVFELVDFFGGFF